MQVRASLRYMLGGLLLCAMPLIAGAQSYWGTKSRWGVPPSLSHLPVVLFSYQYGDTAVTVIDTVRRNGIEIDVDGLAFVPSGGLVAWEITTAGSQMVLLDSTSAAATDLGNLLPGAQLRGACYDRQQDILALDHAADLLLRIRSVDGTIATSVPLTLNGLPYDLGPANDLDLFGGSCYVHAGFTLYELDTLSGALTTVFTDTVIDAGDVLGNCNAVPAVCGVAELPLPDIIAYVAMDGNCEDDLFQYGVITPLSRVELVHDAFGALNGGAEDLAISIAPLSTALAGPTGASPALTATYMPGFGLRLEGPSGQVRGAITIRDARGRVVHVAMADLSRGRTLQLHLAAGLYIVSVEGAGLSPVRFVVP